MLIHIRTSNRGKQKKLSILNYYCLLEKIKATLSRDDYFLRLTIMNRYRRTVLSVYLRKFVFFS